jgi:uncharacterized protein YjlB
MRGLDHVQAFILRDDGTFPNNAELAVLVYPQAFPGADADAIESTFAEHGWDHGWRAGVFGFHHYHSTAHEVLGCYGGHAEILLGGPEGRVVELHAGDAIVLPAGVAHKNVGSSPDFRVVGHYPADQDFDMMYGNPGERPRADRNIAAVPMPEQDPVFGPEGPLVQRWR